MIEITVPQINEIIRKGNAIYLNEAIIDKAVCLYGESFVTEMIGHLEMIAYTKHLTAGLFVDENSLLYAVDGPALVLHFLERG